MTSRTSRASIGRRSVTVLSAVALGVVLSLSGAITANAAQTCEPDSGANFAGKSPTVAQLNRVTLRCADFRGTTLSGIAFDQADLTGADFRRALVTHSDFSQATLTDADFTAATLTGTSFEQATMGGVTLTGTHGSHADFEQVDLSGVSLRGAQLQNADFSQATLTRADLSGADLRDASFDQADVSHANLRGSDVAGADLTEITATGADSTGLIGPPPLDLFGAIIVLIVALLALRPRLLSGAPGRVGAWLVVLVVAALTAFEAVATARWQASGDMLFVLPFLTPVVFIAIFIARVIRRPRNGWPADGIALVVLVGFYLLTTAGLAVVTDNLFGILPFADSCGGPSCGYGVARGTTGIIIGIALIVIGVVPSRLKSLAKPTPDIAQWEAMQAGAGTPLVATRDLGDRVSTSHDSVGASPNQTTPNQTI